MSLAGFSRSEAQYSSGSKINNFHKLSRANGPEGHLRKSTLRDSDDAPAPAAQNRLAARLFI
jgi:hypothetical protein